MNITENIKKIFESNSIKNNFYENDKYIGIYLQKNFIFQSTKLLKEKNDLLFDQLIDITAIDYPSREKRFDLVYILLSMTLNKRIVIKTSIKDNENVESISYL